MQIRDHTLSFKLSDIIKQLLIIAHNFKDFDWSRKGINEYLLIRSSKLFEVKISPNQKDKKPKFKRKIMRSLKYQSVKRKRTFKEFVHQKFSRSKSKKGKQQRSYHNSSKRQNPFARNVIRH